VSPSRVPNYCPACGNCHSAQFTCAEARQIAGLGKPRVPAVDPDVQAMAESNQWHSLDEVLQVLQAVRAGKWHWFANTRCKYIELRIDMRDLGCILRDREGVRISPATLGRQHGAV